MGKNARLKKERRLQREHSSTDGAYLSSSAPSSDPIEVQPLSSMWMVINVLVLSSLAFVLSIFPIESEDIFSNIVTGKLLWTTKTIPELDPFSFTGPHAWLLNRPLPSIIFYWVHELGGLNAIQIFCALLLSCTYALLYVGWTRRVRQPLLTFSIVTVTILASCYWFQTRIYVFAYLYVVLSLLLVTSPNRKRVAWAIPLQVLWINSHPSAILGVIFVGVWWLSTSLRQRHIDRFSSLVLALVIAANAVSPIGLRNFSKFFEELFADHPSRTNIWEWFSPFSEVVSQQHLAFWFYGACALMIVIAGRLFVYGAHMRSAGVLVPITGGLFFLCLGCARHIPLFYLSFASLLICLTEGWFHRQQRGVHFTRWSLALSLVAISLIFKTVSFGYANGNAHRSFRLGIDPRKFPERPIQILKNAKVQGNIFSDYDTGSYFLYRMYPDYKVYIDGARLDEVYGEEGFMHYMKLGNDLNTLLADIKKYDIRAFIVPLPPTESEIVVVHRYLSNDPEWRLAYFDDVNMLFVKKTEAERVGIPTYRYLSPFVSLDKVITSNPDGADALANDVAHGDATNPHSVAYLIMKGKFLNLRGRNQEANQVSQTIAKLCQEEAPSPLCRRQTM
ncbi:MAG: hypothetical protein RL518_2035 [Pseudomonadota bacterium]